MSPEHISNPLHQARLDCDLTRTQLALISGVSYERLRQLEHEPPIGGLPNASTARLLASILRVSVADLWPELGRTGAGHRRQQAVATRQAIIDAGRVLFIEKGYAKATIAEIAARAGVAVQTVYASVGPKPAILDELRKQMPVDAGAAPTDLGAYLSSLDDPQSLIAGLTAAVRRLIETSGDLLHAIEAAAQFEPVAARAWEEGLVIHRSGWAFVCQRLVTFGKLEPAYASRTADIMSMISLPQSWRTLHHEYGWSYDEIEEWIITTSLGLPATFGRRRPDTRDRAPDSH